MTPKQQARKDAGLCVRCGEPRPPGLGWYCQTHQRHQSSSQRKSRQNKASQGLCGDCPNPVKPGCTRCQKCMDRARGRRKGRVELILDALDYCVSLLRDDDRVPPERMHNMEQMLRRRDTKKS